MPDTRTDFQVARTPLRVWPGVVLVALQWLVRYVMPVVVPESSMVAVVGGIAAGGAVLIWWLFFSRALWVERLGAVVFMALALFATSGIVHESVANGMMGMMLPVFAVPLLSVALVVWAVAAGHLGTSGRWAALFAAIAIACGAMTVVRTGGITGDAVSDLHWRWSETPEQRLLAREREEPVAPPASQQREPANDVGSDSNQTAAPARDAEAPAAPAPAPSRRTATAETPRVSPVEEPEAAEGDTTAIRADWPGFRGAARDGIVRNASIATDWSRTPPVQLWRQPVGPGWSSFAVHGDLVYTQEQRGDAELVSSYRLATGAPVWRHRDAARFWESNGGAGPRGTPTFSGGRLYSLGATGIVNALDARSGAVIWSRNAGADTHKKIPGWGFAGSPLVVDGTVVVAAGGILAAYDRTTGQPKWIGPAGGAGYSSPQLATIEGVEQIVLVSAAGAEGVALSDGTLLWKHAWPGDGIVQPAVIGGDVLIGSGSGLDGAAGLRRLGLSHGAEGWNVQERWTSNGLKPYFNDFVVLDGFAYGFDGSILACVDLADGKRKWKGGRYGHGQLVALSEQRLLLVLSEDGELALVKAAPDQFSEVARVPALDGKTWNHPVLVGDVLLVRNGQEMAAFRLSAANR
jgi:outer membrane protein assembly factor BamB